MPKNNRYSMLFFCLQCGRPWVEAVCPYCKSKIGGQRHISATGNAQYLRGYAQSAVVKLYRNLVRGHTLLDLFMIQIYVHR